MAGSQNLNHEGTKIKEEVKSARVHVSFGHDRPMDKLGKFCPICNIIKESAIKMKFIIITLTLRTISF